MDAQLFPTARPRPRLTPAQRKRGLACIAAIRQANPGLTVRSAPCPDSHPMSEPAGL